VAALALIALVAGVVSDFTNGHFWARHSLLAGLAASVIVIMLSIGIVNEVIERRKRQRWSILAQYVMFELIRNARMIWSGVLDVAGLLPAQDDPEYLAAGSQIVHDTPRLTAAVCEVIKDEHARARLHTEIAFLVEHADEVLARWAAVMLNAEVYAEVIDRHVELAGDLGWIGGVLDTGQPPDDLRRHKRSRSSPAVQIESELSPEWLANRIVVITQLAENLDRGTLDLALQIVPVQWWRARLGTADQPDDSDSIVRG
jgi:hypothetical protein